MATKKPVKKVVKKTVKKTVKIRKGSRYTCGVCGIAVVVDTVCGCVKTCDIICCGKQMKK